MANTFVKVSADEAKSKRKDHLRSTSSGDAIAKAMKAPPSWDKESRKARFVMTTQQVDRYGDIVVTAGVDTTEFERNPVGLLFHNSRTWPVAQWDGVAKLLKGRPPRMEGDFVLAPADGPGEIGVRVAEAEFAIANGIVRACSIGFIPNWDEVEAIKDEAGNWLGLRFNESELIECSVCAIPANPGAMAKSLDGDTGLARELVEDVLDNWARSPAGLIIPRAEYETAYREIGNHPVTITVSNNPTDPETQRLVAEAVAKGLATGGLVKPLDGEAPVIMPPGEPILPKAVDGPAIETFDDCHNLSVETVNLLARREVLYCTELQHEGKTYGGLIVAASWNAAEEVAKDRGLSEKVVGQVVSVEKDAAGKIAVKKMLAREQTTEALMANGVEVGSALAKAELMGNSMGTALKSYISDLIAGTPPAEAFAKAFPDAVQKVETPATEAPKPPTRAEIEAAPAEQRHSLLDRLRSLFKAEEPAPVVLAIEPEVVAEPPASVVAAPESIAAARARYDAVLKRVDDKGLLAA